MWAEYSLISTSFRYRSVQHALIAVKEQPWFLRIKKVIQQSWFISSSYVLKLQKDHSAKMYISNECDPNIVFFFTTFCLFHVIFGLPCGQLPCRFEAYVKPSSICIAKYRLLQVSGCIFKVSQRLFSRTFGNKTRPSSIRQD